MTNSTPPWVREMVDAEDAAKQAESILAEGNRLLRSAHERMQTAHRAARDWQEGMKKKARTERDGDSYSTPVTNAQEEGR